MGDAPPELETRHWLWLAGSGLVGISIGDSVYFASIRRIGPAQTLLVDSVLDGISVYDFRRQCERLLARQRRIEADLVMAVPDSGIPAAIGYAEASGINYGEGLIKNKYIGRTFIQPTQEMRETAVHIKLSPIRSNIEGKRLIVVDDSIVRGTNRFPSRRNRNGRHH